MIVAIENSDGGFVTYLGSEGKRIVVKPNIEVTYYSGGEVEDGVELFGLKRDGGEIVGVTTKFSKEGICMFHEEYSKEDW